MDDDALRKDPGELQRCSHGEAHAGEGDARKKKKKQARRRQIGGKNG